MTPSRGYAVELAGVVIIALASTYGLPVSTTQIIVSVLPPLRTAHIKRFMRSHLHAFTCKQCKEIWKQAGVLVSKSLWSHLSVMVIVCPTCKAYLKGWPEPYIGPYIHLICMVLVNPTNLATVPCAPVAWRWDGIGLLYQGILVSDVGQCSFLLKLSYKGFLSDSKFWADGDNHSQGIWHVKAFDVTRRLPFPHPCVIKYLCVSVDWWRAGYWIGGRLALKASELEVSWLPCLHLSFFVASG